MAAVPDPQLNWLHARVNLLISAHLLDTYHYEASGVPVPTRQARRLRHDLMRHTHETSRKMNHEIRRLESVGVTLSWNVALPYGADVLTHSNLFDKLAATGSTSFSPGRGINAAKRKK